MEVNKHILQNAKLQRKTKNPWEAKLWYHLRANRMLGFKFKRQMPIGRYIVDFCCRPKRLVIELDGGQHFVQENIRKDEEKERYLKQEKFEVLRFQNIDIDNKEYWKPLEYH